MKLTQALLLVEHSSTSRSAIPFRALEMPRTWDVSFALQRWKRVGGSYGKKRKVLNWILQRCYLPLRMLKRWYSLLHKKGTLERNCCLGTKYLENRMPPYTFRIPPIYSVYIPYTPRLHSVYIPYTPYTSVDPPYTSVYPVRLSKLLGLKCWTDLHLTCLDSKSLGYIQFWFQKVSNSQTLDWTWLLDFFKLSKYHTKTNASWIEGETFRDIYWTLSCPKPTFIGKCSANVSGHIPLNWTL